MRKYRKKKYSIKAKKVSAGTVIYNFLEDVEYITTEEENIVLIGTCGEMWITTEEYMKNSYNIEKQRGNQYILSTKVDNSSPAVFAEQTTKQINIKTSWGHELKANRPGILHGQGDYIVYAEKDGRPYITNRWVVNGLVFPNTYEEVE